MFVKYEKTKRIDIPQININKKAKQFLSLKETQALLNGKVYITEKLDGANTGIIKTSSEFRLQKRGSLVGDSEHFQFAFFKAWANQNYNKLMSIPKDTILYGELMVVKHSIFYDSLVDFFIPFAWYDIKSKIYFSYDQLKDLCSKIDLHPAPLLYSGNISKNDLYNLIPDKSNFSSDQKPEGIVVFNYKKQMRGKVVRPEFYKEANENWRYTKLTYNKLRT